MWHTPPLPTSLLSDIRSYVNSGTKKHKRSSSQSLFSINGSNDLTSAMEVNRYSAMCDAITKSHGGPMLEVFAGGLPQDVQEELGTYLLFMHEDAGSLETLLRQAVMFEAGKTVDGLDSNQMFRENGLCVKIIAELIKTAGRDYLRDILVAPITKIVEKSSSSWEFDPTYKIDGKEIGVTHLKKSFQTFVSTTTKLLDAIYSSIPKCPPIILFVLGLVREAMNKVAPGKVDLGIGSFFFLRFVSPAIVFPEIHSIIGTEISANARHNLKLVANAVQKVATGVNYGKKEPYLVNANQFLQDQTKGMKKFIGSFNLSILKGSGSLSIGVDLKPIQGIYRAAFHVLAHKHLDKIVQFAQQVGKQDAIADLQAALIALGTPRMPPSCGEDSIRLKRKGTSKHKDKNASSVRWTSGDSKGDDRYRAEDRKQKDTEDINRHTDEINRLSSDLFATTTQLAKLESTVETLNEKLRTKTRQMDKLQQDFEALRMYVLDNVMPR